MWTMNSYWKREGSSDSKGLSSENVLLPFCQARLKVKSIKNKCLFAILVNDPLTIMVSKPIPKLNNGSYIWSAAGRLR
jgi:hypothetical protein